jgi:hypothetical protein
MTFIHGHITSHIPDAFEHDAYPNRVVIQWGA